MFSFRTKVRLAVDPVRSPSADVSRAPSSLMKPGTRKQVITPLRQLARFFIFVLNGTDFLAKIIDWAEIYRNVVLMTIDKLHHEDFRKSVHFVSSNIETDRQFNRWKIDANQTIWGWRIAFWKWNVYLGILTWSTVAQPNATLKKRRSDRQRNQRPAACGTELKPQAQISSNARIYPCHFLKGPSFLSKWIQANVESEERSRQMNSPKSFFVSRSILVSSLPASEENGSRRDSLEFFKGANIVESFIPVPCGLLDLLSMREKKR